MLSHPPTIYLAAHPMLRGKQAHSHALPLQVLFANVVNLSGFVCARGIKHLMLLIPNPDCGNISSALAGLEHLETLWLASFGETPQASGALQLSAHERLQSLALIRIVPESISCNDSCELHVQLPIESMEHPVWETVLPRVRSVRLWGHSRQCRLVALPSILHKAGNLLSAELKMPLCGTATVPVLLGGPLAHVEELVLRCLELHAVVPAHVTWRSVYMAAPHLNLRFEAVASFGEAVPAFCFRFSDLQVCSPQPSLYFFVAITVPPAPHLLIARQGTSLSELEAIVARRLPDWTGTLRMKPGDAIFSTPVTSGMCFPPAPPPDMNEVLRCRCGACPFCMSAGGIMH